MGKGGQWIIRIKIIIHHWFLHGKASIPASLHTACKKTPRDGLFKRPSFLLLVMWGEVSVETCTLPESVKTQIANKLSSISSGAH